MFVRKIATAFVLAFALPLAVLSASLPAVPVAQAAGGCWEGNGDISLCFGGESSGIPKPKGAISVGDGTIESGVRNKAVAIANRVITLAAVVAIAGIVFAGFHMVTAFGDDEKHKKGKEALKWAVLGFAVALLSFPLVNATINFFYATGG